MNMLFHKMRTGKMGQIVAILTVALVIFVIAAFLVVNLGKSKIQDTRILNGAQAGVLAGGSSACVLLNSMANINDNMILNFVGFGLMVQFMIASWIMDYIKLCVEAAKSYPPYSYMALVNIAIAVATLILTTMTLEYMLIGTYKVGTALKKMIDELNAKLPENSRDSARQYSFSNSGVDEPKIPFSKSGCSDAWCYSLIETKFDTFMRLLPTTNQNDKNYGTTDLAFDWDDYRNGNTINNKINVEVTPVPTVPLRLVTYGEVSFEAGSIISYLNTKPQGLLGPLIKLGVLIAALVLAALIVICGLVIYLGVVLTIAAVYHTYMAITYTVTCLSCSWFFCACCWACPLAVYHWAAAAVFIPLAIWTDKVAYDFLSIYANYSPFSMPAFVWEQSYDHPISETVTRTTSPSSTNYGIYTTNWPTQSESASGKVTGGTIFPPNQMYDLTPNF